MIVIEIKRTLWHIGIIILVSLTLGLTGLLLSNKNPVGWDAVSYFSAAQNFFLGRGLVTSLCSVTPAWIMGVPHPDPHMPGYPLLLALFMWLTRTGVYAPWLLDTFLIVLAAILIYFTIRFRTTHGVSLMGSVVFLLSPVTLIYGFTGLAEIAIAFWVILSVFLASCPGSGRRIGYIMGSGLALFVAYMTRESSILFLPLIMALLIQHGASLKKSLIFGLCLAAICYGTSSLYFSFRPGLNELNIILYKWSLFSYTGDLSSNPFLEIVDQKDFPSLSTSQFIWDVFFRKPIRVIMKVAETEVWYFTTLNLVFICVLALAPILTRERWQRIGLAFFFLVIPAMLTLYFPTHGRLIRVAFPFVIVALIFIIIWIGNSIRKTISMYILLISILLLWLIAGIAGLIDRMQDCRKLTEISPRVESIMKEHLSPGTRIIGIFGSALPQHVVYEPKDILVTYPTNPIDAALLQEKLGIEAVVFTKTASENAVIYSQEEMAALGWQGKVFVSGGDSVFIYTKRKE